MQRIEKIGFAAAAAAVFLTGCDKQESAQSRVSSGARSNAPTVAQVAKPQPNATALPTPQWKGKINLTTTDTLRSVFDQLNKQSGVAYTFLDKSLETSTVAVAYKDIGIEAANADLTQRYHLNISMPNLDKVDADSTPTAEVAPQIPD